MPTQEEREHLRMMAGSPKPPTAEETMKLMKAQSKLQQKVDEFKRIEREAIEEKEADRWGERLNWIHTKYGVDGSGVDSGDQLDVIESEIRQAFNALESDLSAAKEREKELLEIIKLVYRKHHMGDGRIGWVELGEKMMDALCNSMGDEEYQRWVEEVGREIDAGNLRVGREIIGTR